MRTPLNAKSPGCPDNLRRNGRVRENWLDRTDTHFPALDPEHLPRQSLAIEPCIDIAAQSSPSVAMTTAAPNIMNAKESNPKNSCVVRIAGVDGKSRKLRTLLQKKRTNTIPACGVAGNIELTSKLQSLIAVQYVKQRSVVNVANRAMKKTGPYRAIGLHHGGNPGRVAAWGYCFRSPEVRAEVKRDTAELIRIFNNKAGFDIFSVITKQGFDFKVKYFDFSVVQSYQLLSFCRPAFGAIESVRTDIRSQKRNGVQFQFVGSANGTAERLEVIFLDGTPSLNRHVRAQASKSLYSAFQSHKCFRNGTDIVMCLRWSVKRHNHVVHPFGHFSSMPLEYQSGSEEREAHTFLSKQPAQRRQIGMHQRLAAGEDDPLHVEGSQARNVRFEIPVGDFPDLPNPPDVTHYTTAIATIVRKENEDRQFRDAMF